MGMRDSTQNAFHIGSEPRLVGTTLEDSRFDAGIRNSFADVPNEHFREWLRARSSVRLAQMEIKRQVSIRVDTGCDDDVELRLSRNTQDTRDAATQTQYGKVDNSIPSMGFQLVQTRDGVGNTFFFAAPFLRVVLLDFSVQNEDVLVHQRGTKLRRIHWASSGLNGCQARYS